MANQKTANQSYVELETIVQAQISQLQQLLESHAQKQARDQRNWCFAGDLQAVKENLDVIVEFMSN